MIGLLPAAGTAERFNGLPKYLLPCPGGNLLYQHTSAMLHSGCGQTFIGCNHDNLSLVQYYISAPIIPYLPNSYTTMTETVLGAFRHAYDSSVLFGMPDTYFDFPLVYERLTTRLNASTADVVLAVFKARPEQHRQGGMVSVSHNQVVDIVDKPEVTTLQYIWGAMAWRAAFWQCLAPDMPHVGYGVKVALERGLNVQAVICAGEYYDCGTFDRYVEMLKANTGNDKRV